MRRVSIVEIMQQTGLSRATVDRVLNGRGRVHARTREAVEETVRNLRALEPDRQEGGPEADIVLRLGRGMLGLMRTAWEGANASGAFHDMYQANEREMVRVVGKLCEDVSRPLIVTTMNTSKVADVLRDARRRGKKIISMISDISADARDFHVGIDDRAAGRTAAFLVGRILGDRPTTVGVVVGDIAYRNHEDREIGFRTGLRAHFPKVVVSGEAFGGDNVEATFDAASRLLAAHPALSALYNVGGANFGLVKALKEAGRSQDVLVIGHEVNSVTAPLIREESMDFSIATDPSLLLARAFSLLGSKEEDRASDTVLLDFAIYTRFNMPSFANLADTP
jgi:LacI family transcriptional regulator